MNEDMLPENIEIALYHPDQHIRADMIREIGPNLQKYYIDVAIKDPEWRVRRSVVEACNLTEEQVDFLLDDPSPNVRILLTDHFTTVKQYNKGLTDKSPAVCRSVALLSPFTNEDIITDILTNCKYEYLRRDILGHKLLNSYHITIALKDDDTLVRIEALKKKHLITKKQLKYIANNDPDDLVKHWAARELYIDNHKLDISKRYSDN